LFCRKRRSGNGSKTTPKYLRVIANYLPIGEAFFPDLFIFFFACCKLYFGEPFGYSGDPFGDISITKQNYNYILKDPNKILMM
jgi:hypothetical protein